MPTVRRTTARALSPLVASLVAVALASAPATSLEAQRRRPRRPARSETPAEAPAATPPAETPAEGNERALSEADRAQARALFQAGAAAVDAGRWADAIDSFRQAYALTGAPSALFNTGFALRALGRYREALTAFEELLTLPGVTDATRAQTRELVTELRARIGGVRLLGLEAETRYGVRLDGAGVEDGGLRPLVIEVDPGTHAVDVSLQGFEPFSWTGPIGDGQRVDVTVQLHPLAMPHGGGSVFEEAWFWAVVGGVILVGGGIATYVVLDQAAQVQPQSSMVVHL